MIRARKKPYDFNKMRYCYPKKRKTLVERIFPKSNGFWWDNSWNGVFGPGSYSSYSFKSGNLALVIAIIGIVFIVGYIIFDLFIK